MENYELENYSRILSEVKNSPGKRVVAVVSAADRMVLEGVIRAKKESVCDAILIGNKEKISTLLHTLGEDPANYHIENTGDDPNAAAEAATALVKKGEANFLMKGLIETSDFLRPVVKKENGLRNGRTMSHLAFNSFPGYHKLLVNTDGGMCTYPDLQTKRDILENAFSILRTLGYTKPKAAVLCCKETPDRKMPETLDARALQEEAEQGKFGSCAVVGPISYDIAMSPSIAEEKGFSCEYCGDFDVVLQPDIHTGNIFGKSLLINAQATLAGIVAGARIPIILTSRGSSAEEKYLSIALAALVAARS